MKVKLISCRSPYIDSDKVYPPLANLYLHQAIKTKVPEAEVEVTDEYYLDDPSWLIDLDYLGVSIMTPQRAEAQRVLKFVKEQSPQTKVIAGGPHVKHYLDDVVKEDWDFVVPLDGIRPIVQILNGKQERVINDFIPLREYPTEWVKPNRMDNQEFLNGFTYTLNGRRATTMLTAQGCPMACTFCEDAKTIGRWTPLDLIKEELDDIVSLGYKAVYLFDDLFAIAMPKVKPIAEELKKRDLIYRCNGQANFFTRWGEDFAKLLSDTGCVEIAFGHESGSQKILDNVDKRTKVEQNYQSVEFARKHGIKVKSFLMIGLPGETYETIRQTEDFIKTARPDDFQLAIYYPYKGTQIRDAIDKGQSGFDLMFQGEGLGAYGQKGGVSEATVRTSELSQEDLLRERDRLLDIYRPKSHSTRQFHDIHLDK